MIAVIAQNVKLFGVMAASGGEKPKKSAQKTAPVETQGQNLPVLAARGADRPARM